MAFKMTGPWLKSALKHKVKTLVESGNDPMQYHGTDGSTKDTPPKYDHFHAEGLPKEWPVKKKQTKEK